MPQDSTQSILKSAKRFFSGTVVSRLTGMLRDVLMAFAFGAGESVAAFFVAFRLSNLLRRVLGEGAMQSALIPHLEGLKKDSPKRAALFFRDLNVGLSLLLIGIIVLMMLGSFASLKFLALSEGNREILWLMCLMMPGLLFICLFGINAALLQGEKNYFTTGVSPSLFNLLWILGIFLFWKSSKESALSGLALFVVLGSLAQWLMTFPRTYAYLKLYGLKAPFENLQLLSSDMKSLLKPLFLGITGVAASQVNNALDAIFARYVDAEGPAYLWYAIRLQQLPLALFGIAVSGAILPPLTRAIKEGNLGNYKHFLEYALGRSVSLMLPISCAILLMGHSAVNLVYGHGDFDGKSIVGTTQCLWAYGLGLIPMTLVLTLAPGFYALNDYSTPTKASLLSMALNILLNTFFVTALGFGAFSIALATGLSAWVNAGMLAYYLSIKVGKLTTPLFWAQLGKVLLATVTAMSVLLSAEVFFSGNVTAWEIAQNLPRLFSQNIASQLLELSFSSSLFFLTLGSFWMIRKWPQWAKN